MKNLSRREFLKRASAISAAAGVASPLAINLAAIGSASAAVASDYKALVCVFLYGGNDHANTVVPSDSTNFNLYKGFRPSLYIPDTSLVNTVLRPTNDLGGRQYALAPNMKPLSDIFNTQRKLAVIANIGTLIRPTSKADYASKRSLLPKLMSHNDQQSFWQSGGPEGTPTGWAGRMGDLLMSQNGTNSSFTCMSPGGNAVFMTGNSVLQYQTLTSGPISFSGLDGPPLFGSPSCSTVLNELLTGTQENVIMVRDLRSVSLRSIKNGKVMNSALQTVTNPIITGWAPGGNSLSAQLQFVLKAIDSSASLGIKRQVFFVSMGGFDTHDGLKSAHPVLIKKVSDAMSEFYNRTVSLGIADRVTSFTASDFGRSWGNDDGSDHGWGSFHFVLGGSVRGGRILGAPPVLANNGPDDIGQGRLLPTTSVDQLAATLGKWMGLTSSQLNDVLPNLSNFNTTDLDFMV